MGPRAGEEVENIGTFFGRIGAVSGVYCFWKEDTEMYGFWKEDTENKQRM